MGIDLDNTLISYDELFCKVAEEEGLLETSSNDPSISLGKTQIRQAVQSLHNGEYHWQKLQGLVYGKRIGEATLVPGVNNFLLKCLHNEIPIYIVSHKTKTAHHDPTKLDLHRAAMQWMSENRFFIEEGFGLNQTQVFFEETRLGKLKRIGKLQCTHFIDDLEEVFSNVDFPQNVTKILYRPRTAKLSRMADVTGDWEQINSYFFH